MNELSKQYNLVNISRLLDMLCQKNYVTYKLRKDTKGSGIKFKFEDLEHNEIKFKFMISKLE